MSDIETAKPRDRLVDQGADVIVLADVGVDELGLRTERAQFFNERLAGLITPAGTTTFAPFLATAAARPMPVKAPVINTTGLLICDPRNLPPYRQSMEPDPWLRISKDRDHSQVLSLKAM
jgi:hypothetical protein